jgi:hypothetical protein
MGIRLGSWINRKQYIIWALVKTMSKDNWGSTADWLNASANLQQARTLNSMNESMQRQNNLISQQNAILNSQQLKIENIANSRRLIIDFENKLADLSSLAETKPEYTFCILEEMKIELSIASKYFEEFEDIERSNTTLSHLTQFSDSIRSKFDDSQHEVVKTLPTIPQDVEKINEIISYKYEAESLSPRINTSNLKNKSRRKFSIIPVILILILCPWAFLNSVIEVEQLGQIELNHNTVTFYNSDTDMREGISLANLTEIALLVETYPFSGDKYELMNSYTAYLVRESFSPNFTQSFDNWPEEGVYLDTTWEEEITKINEIQITSDCTSNSVHCKLIERFNETRIYLTEYLEVTKIEHYQRLSDSYHVGPVFIDEEYGEEYASHVIKYSIDSVGIAQNNTTGEYYYVTAPVNSYFSQNEIVESIFRSYSGQVGGYGIGMSTLVNSMDEEMVCSSIDFSTFTETGSRPEACNGSYTLSSIIGLPLIGIFFFLRRSPESHKALIRRNQFVTNFISSSSLGNETIQSLTNNRDELINYYQYYTT